MLSGRRAAAPVLMLALGLGLGFGAGRWTAPDLPAAALVCRPSGPQLAAERAGKPIVLFLGNSLIFDHGWRIAGALAVNCARQGMVAGQAPALVAALPEMAPEIVVLGFGTVEALRAGLAGTPIDAAGFKTASRALAGTVRTRWPGADIVWLGLPETRPGPIRPGDIRTLNAALAGLAETDPGQRLLGAGPLASYDGVHLEEVAYTDWERAISALAAGR